MDTQDKIDKMTKMGTLSSNYNPDKVDPGKEVTIIFKTSEDDFGIHSKFFSTRPSFDEAVDTMYERVKEELWEKCSGYSRDN